MGSIGSLFAGVGCLDLACEWVFGEATAWQVDLLGHDVRRRHFPDALQVAGDVRDVEPLNFPPITTLAGGFPCTDLSVASPTKTGLNGARSGLYSEVLRFTKALRPRRVVLENVPALLKWRDRVESDFGRLGYGLTWVDSRAEDAGAPHRRRRVFVLATRGKSGRGMLKTPRRDFAGRCWPTPSRRDYRTGELNKRTGGQSLSAAASRYPNHHFGSRLNPDWVECLMGLPIGWTCPDGPALTALRAPQWPRGRYPDDWPAADYWPGHEWEPERCIPDGPPVRGRAVRVRALGNAVCPQQAAMALREATTISQATLFPRIQCPASP